jgi:predicted DNA-binding protein YlxM (UPF0122 family)
MASGPLRLYIPGTRILVAQLLQELSEEFSVQDLADDYSISRAAICDALSSLSEYLRKLELLRVDFRNCTKRLLENPDDSTNKFFAESLLMRSEEAIKNEGS